MARNRRRVQRRNSCENKDKLTKEQAIGQAKRLQRKDGAIMQAYRCRFRCKMPNGQVSWHVGHAILRKNSGRR